MGTSLNASQEGTETPQQCNYMKEGDYMTKAGKNLIKVYIEVSNTIKSKKEEK